MSTDILYRRQFIKIDEKRVIPMVEAGSSNCWEVGNKRRARSWFANSWVTGGRLIGTAEDIVKQLETDRQERIERNKNNPPEDQYDDKYYGHFVSVRMHGRSRLTYNAYKSFYLNGCKEAMTVEELVEQGVYPEVSVYLWDVQKWEAETGKKDLGRTSCRTTQELLDTIEKYTNHYNRKDVSISFSEWSMKRFFEKKYWENKRKKGERNRQMEYRWVEGAYALELIDKPYHYFVKNTRRAVQYTYNVLGARAFATEKEAKTFHRKMANRGMFQIKQLVDKVQIKFPKVLEVP